MLAHLLCCLGRVVDLSEAGFSSVKWALVSARGVLWGSHPMAGYVLAQHAWNGCREGLLGQPFTPSPCPQCGTAWPLGGAGHCWLEELLTYLHVPIQHPVELCEPR